MPTKLHISNDLQLPLDTQTRTSIIYGGKGQGKTNLGRVLVEEHAYNHLRFCVVDPLDVWWGLQHSATRDGAGIDVVILGGTHGDVPIDPTSGAVVADFVADEPCSTVIVLRRADGTMWSNGERLRFVTDFCTRLFARQGEHRLPLFLAIDEAGRFCPQNPGKGDIDVAKCIGAIEQLVEWGRNAAIGVCLITQRSARMNKSVSELADMMIAFCTVGPNSIAAIVDWFGEHIPKERHKELVAQLRTLERGSALVVSPAWLKYEGVARMRLAHTFDSSATPAPGKALRAPGPARKPDLEKYRTRMAETIERAQADDPKTMRARITQLERELAAAKKTAPAPEPKRIEVPMLDETATNDLAAAGGAVEDAAQHLGEATAALKVATELFAELKNVATGKIDAYLRSAQPRAASSIATSSRPTAPERQAAHRARTNCKANGHAAAAADEPKLERCSRAQLGVLAQRVGMCTTDVQLSILTGYSLKSSSFDNGLGQLRGLGYASGDRHDIRITDAGLAHAGDVEPYPTGPALLSMWLGKLEKAERTLLTEIHRVYPRAIGKDELSKATGYSVSSSSFDNALGRLRSLELIQRGELRASEALFP